EDLAEALVIDVLCAVLIARDAVDRRRDQSVERADCTRMFRHLHSPLLWDWFGGRTLECASRCHIARENLPAGPKCCQSALSALGGESPHKGEEQQWRSLAGLCSNTLDASAEPAPLTWRWKRSGWRCLHL